MIKNQRIRIQAPIFILLGLTLSLYCLYQLSLKKIDLMLSPYLFPLLIGVLLAFFGLIMVQNNSFKQQEKDEKKAWLRVLVVLAFTFCYLLFMPIFHFMPASFLYLAGIYYYLGERNMVKMVTLSAGTSLVLYLVFEKLLYVRLP